MVNETGPARKAEGFSTFDLRFLLAAMGAAACVCAWLRMAIDVRESVITAPTAVREGSEFCASKDGRYRALRVEHAGLVIVLTDSRQVFSIELLWHPYDGHLYAIDRLAHRSSQRWQRWNQVRSKWEPAHEGWLALVHSARGILPMLFCGFLLSLPFCFRARFQSCARGIALSVGAACALIAVLQWVPMTWQASSIVAAAFSPDASLLATASVHGADSVICVWDAETGKGIAKLDMANAYAESLAFSPDGKKLTVQPAGMNIDLRDLKANR